MSRPTLAEAALPHLLESFPGAAWLLDAEGRVHATNAAGRAQPELEEELRSWTASGTVPPPAVEVRRFDGGAVVVRREPLVVGDLVKRATERFELTPAQARVLDLVVAGLSNGVIAHRLEVSRRTVETHITAILEKTAVTSRSALIARVLEG